MKLFNIFDQWGNKIGEVYEAGDPLDGFGGLLGGFALFVVGVGAIVIWPVFFKLLFHRYTTDYERSCGIVQFVSIIIMLASVGYFRYKAEKYSFLNTWSGMLTFCTIIPGIISWFYGYVHGEREFGLLIGYFFICFLMSIGGGFAGTIIVLIARAIKFRVKK